MTPLRTIFYQLKVWCDTNRPDSHVLVSRRGLKCCHADWTEVRLLPCFALGNNPVCWKIMMWRGDETGHLWPVNTTGFICASFTRMPAGNLFKHIQHPRHSAGEPAPSPSSLSHTHTHRWSAAPLGKTRVISLVHSLFFCEILDIANEQHPEVLKPEWVYMLDQCIPFSSRWIHKSHQVHLKCQWFHWFPLVLFISLGEAAAMLVRIFRLFHTLECV